MTVEAARISRQRGDVHAASLWEVAINVQTGRLTLPLPLDDLSAAVLTIGFVELPVRAIHAVAVTRLPLHHRDPYDWLLVAQAMVEPARFLTVDAPLRQYSDLEEIVTPYNYDFRHAAASRRLALKEVLKKRPK